MCDYSLEAYRSRPAQQGEVYETIRFPSGSVGFVVAGASTTDYSKKAAMAPVTSVLETFLSLFRDARQALVSPVHVDTAVCMACDMRLRLQGIPRLVRKSFNVMETEEVTFVRIETGRYHDGVRFANGSEVTLQRLGPGVKAVVIDALSMPQLMPHKGLKRASRKEPVNFEMV